MDLLCEDLERHGCIDCRSVVTENPRTLLIPLIISEISFEMGAMVFLREGVRGGRVRHYGLHDELLTPTAGQHLGHGLLAI
jgi:hypothetical protein